MANYIVNSVDKPNYQTLMKNLISSRSFSDSKHNAKLKMSTFSFVLNSLQAVLNRFIPLTTTVHESASDTKEYYVIKVQLQLLNKCHRSSPQSDQRPAP